jgi:transcriptional regulator with XRE-family HTH domain
MASRIQGEFISRRMQELGMSRASLAAAIGVTRQEIHRICHGGAARVPVLLRIATELHICPGKLFSPNWRCTGGSDRVSDAARLSIRELVHEFAVLRRVSLAEVASASGLGTRSMSRILSGEPPSIAHLIALQRELACCFCTLAKPMMECVAPPRR